MITLTLPEDIEAWARAEVSAGRAASVESLIASVLRERANDPHAELVREAYRSVQRGDLIDEDAMDAELGAWIAADLGRA